MGRSKTKKDELEELEDIRLYDEAKDTKEVTIPIEEAFKMIEEARSQKSTIINP